MKNLSELHSCEKSEGKIVLIEVDNLGNESYGYCHKRVKYSEWFKKEHPEFEEIKKRKQEIYIK